jgi:hypothetical protein
MLRLASRSFVSTTRMPRYESERRVAVAAVLKACHVASKVQADLVDSEKAIKDDNSPVTGEL